MGATNHTPNYNLPQFIGTDKPTWLSDVNGAFSDIDTQMKANATSAAQGISDAASASTVATSANNKANTLDTQINTPGTGLAAVVSGHTTAITSINSDIGSTVLPTIAQTLTGAIDELYNDITGSSVSINADGVKTYSQLMDELFALVTFANVSRNSKLIFSTSAGDSFFDLTNKTGVLVYSNATSSDTDFYVTSLTLKSSGSTYYASARSSTLNQSTTVPAVGFQIILYY